MRLPAEWRWFGAVILKKQSCGSEKNEEDEEEEDEAGFAHSGLEYIHRLRRLHRFRTDVI